MLLSIAADEAAALQFDDLASALDAGLSPVALGGRADAGERTVHELLRSRRVVLTPTEDAVLLAGQRAGSLARLLRQRAEQRRSRAALARQLWTGLRYPALLVVCVSFVSLFTAPIVGHHGFLIGAGLGLLLLLLLVAAVRRGLRTGSERWLRLPVVGNLAAAFGELPYLETLQALYGAGVKLAQAHPAAVATVPVAAVRARLQVADRILQQGRPLADALAQALALHAETRALLATGEPSGQLEDALGRALARRREVAGRGAANAARRAGIAAYWITVLAVVWIVSDFYGAYFGKLLR
ncbi:MAG: hypothetical protein FJ265_08410 [Planctomycetes bacterium]|nr:hypothetical protein [Planctomycetota bacterium]